MSITEDQVLRVANVAGASALLLKSLLLILRDKVPNFKTEMYGALTSGLSSVSYNEAIIEQVEEWIDDLDDEDSVL